MRKLLLTAVGAVAMATASMASAAVTVTASSGLTGVLGDPFANPGLVTNNADGSSNIGFGMNPVSHPNFAGSFTFSNSIAGIYNITLGTSTSGVQFTSAVISGGACTALTCTLGGLPGQNLVLNGALLAANTAYTFSFGGTNSRTTTGGILTGNVSIDPAVPEPATWAMMLLGFGGIGLAMRRRRRPALAQIA